MTATRAGRIGEVWIATVPYYAIQLTIIGWRPTPAADEPHDGLWEYQAHDRVSGEPFTGLIAESDLLDCYRQVTA